ncbi:MAG: maleylpyruvate isomerase N-terminal domain-containing protein [Nitriliruptorales bacterium]
MVIDVFHGCAKAAQRLIEHDAVAARWDEPSALEGYTVGGLAGHLARAALTVERYLEAPEPPPDREPADAAGYLVAVLGAHDPVDSEFHRAVRARGAEAAADGPAAVAASLREARTRLAAGLDAATLERRVEVLDGLVLTVEEYLRTRILELVVHVDDLSVSVGLPGADGVPADAYDMVAAVLARVAARRHGGLATVRSLARRERHPDAIRAL